MGRASFVHSLLGWVDRGLSQQFDASDNDLDRLAPTNSFKRTRSELCVADDTESDAECLHEPDDSELVHREEGDTNIKDYQDSTAEIPAENSDKDEWQGVEFNEERWRRLLEKVVCYLIGLDRVPKQEAIDFLLWYGILASAMLVLNKEIIFIVKNATELLIVQLGGATLIVLLLHFTSTATVRLWPGTREATAWIFVAVGFLLSVYCSVETLRYGDVAWYMTLHYVEPLGVCFLDWLWLRRRPPTVYSISSLLVIVASSVWWMWYRTGNFHPGNDSVLWGVTWLIVMVVYLTFLKYVVTIYPKATPWERVLYMNMYACVGLLGFSLSKAIYTNNWRIGRDWETVKGNAPHLNATHLSSDLPKDMAHLSDGDALSAMADLRFHHLHDALLVNDGTMWDPAAFALVLLSCACGTGLSYTKLRLLTYISATGYAMFSVVALLPVRVWQVMSKIG